VEDLGMPQQLPSPDPAALLALHDRLLAGHLKAVDEIVAALLTVSPIRIARRRPGVDPAAAYDSVVRAVLAYLEHPTSFSRDRSQLQTFIEFAARRNLIDHIRSEATRRKYERAYVSYRIVQAEESADLYSPTSLAAAWPRLMRVDGPLTDRQWQCVACFLRSPATGSQGRPIGDPRPLRDGIIWVLRHGGRWRSLPSKFPPHSSCFKRFRQWCRVGLLQRALDRLEADLRRRRSFE
jgi:transposase